MKTTPAFSSARRAGSFALLLLVLLLLPVLFVPSFLPDREEVYSSLSTRFGPFHFIEQQIYHETSDVDVAFVGSSHMICGIDTPYVQEKFSERLHRPAVVITLGWGTAGFDGAYFVARDLLRHRKVRMLVVYDEYTAHQPDLPHHICSHWFRFGEDHELLEGLPIQSQLALYGSAILGMPRNILGLVRPDLSTRWTPGQMTRYDRYFHSPDPAERLGSEAAHLAYGEKPTFTEYIPATEPAPTSTLLFSEANRDKFRFPQTTDPPYQLHFARLLTDAAAKHGTPLVMLHLPEMTEAGSATINETADWPSQLANDLSIVGIPPVDLFAPLSHEEVTRLYLDDGHFNQNGQRYFTAAITPALFQIYDAATKPKQ